MEKKMFEEEIDLVWIFKALLKRAWLILLVAVVTACGMAGYAYFRTEPTYTSTSTMLVLTKETTLTSLADLQIGSQLTKDYTILITSRPVLEEVIDKLELNMSYKQLKGLISISNPEDTRILAISVTTNNAKQAKKIVDTLSEVAADFVHKKMEVAPPKIIEKGEVGVFKVGPVVSKKAMIGFLLGALAVCALIVVLELMNDSIQTEEDVERYLDLPTLASVPERVALRKKDNKEKGRVK